MATTTIRIHGKSYLIRTADGQEEHVQKLGHKLNQHVFDLSERLEGADKEYLLVLTSIMVLDELSDQEKVPKKLEEDIKKYKDKLLDTQNYVEALKLQLESYDPTFIEKGNKEAVKQAQKFFEDAQDLKFEEQRRLYEKQIEELQNQIIENQKGESRPGELEDLIETSLKNQKEQLVFEFKAEIEQQKKQHQQEIEELEKRLKTKENEQKDISPLEVDPLFDRLQNIAKRAEKA